jgi:hypothetical protein
VLAAQLVHAAGESSPGVLPPNTHAIVLTAINEQKLLALEHELQSNQVDHIAIREPDSPWDGQLMAIGVIPGPKKQLRKYFSQLPLLKELRS